MTLARECRLRLDEAIGREAAAFAGAADPHAGGLPRAGGARSCSAAAPGELRLLEDGAAARAPDVRSREPRTP